jgi:two-component system, NarL family, sensor kinase
MARYSLHLKDSTDELLDPNGTEMPPVEVPGAALRAARDGPHSDYEPNQGVDFQEIQEVIDGLVEQVALVSCDGIILAVNDCWRQQVERQSRTGLHISRDYIAFLESLIEEGDKGVEPILQAFREISAGSRRTFRRLYKGSGTFDGYDFNIIVAPLTIHGTRHVLVSVHDVTELVGLKRQRRRVRGQLLRAQEDERRRMARELHDSTSQMLVALRYDLSRLGREKVGPDAFAIIHECKEMLQEIQREIRTFSFVAHPPSLTADGLAIALQNLVSGFAKRTGLEIDVEVSGFSEAFKTVEATIYRLSQEALANIYRHAGATHATVRLVGRRSCLHLVIADDGLGFHVPDEASRNSFGVGVTGMQERVRELGGRMSLQRVAERTVLAVSLPRYKRTTLEPPIGAS